MNIEVHASFSSLTQWYSDSLRSAEALSSKRVPTWPLRSRCSLGSGLPQMSSALRVQRSRQSRADDGGGHLLSYSCARCFVFSYMVQCFRSFSCCIKSLSIHVSVCRCSLVWPLSKARANICRCCWEAEERRIGDAFSQSEHRGGAGTGFRVSSPKLPHYQTVYQWQSQQSHRIRW